MPSSALVGDRYAARRSTRRSLSARIHVLLNSAGTRRTLPTPIRKCLPMTVGNSRHVRRSTGCPRDSRRDRRLVGDGSAVAHQGLVLAGAIRPLGWVDDVVRRGVCRRSISGMFGLGCTQQCKCRGRFSHPGHPPCHRRSVPSSVGLPHDLRGWFIFPIRCRAERRASSRPLAACCPPYGSSSPRKVGQRRREFCRRDAPPPCAFGCTSFAWAAFYRQQAQLSCR